MLCDQCKKKQATQIGRIHPDIQTMFKTRTEIFWIRACDDCATMLLDRWFLMKPLEAVGTNES